MGNSSKKTKSLRGRKVKAVASAPPKVEVVGNVEETTPLFQTPVVAVPVGADFGESLRQQHVTTRVGPHQRPGGWGGRRMTVLDGFSQCFSISLGLFSVEVRAGIFGFVLRGCRK